jgi:hypothetical protein
MRADIKKAIDCKADKNHTHDGGPGGASWGGITGTLSNQADLQTELDGKSPSGHNHDGTYSAAGHNHDAQYSLLNHTHPGGGAVVKSGSVNLTAGGTSNITFTSPFSSVPVVVVTAQFANTDTSCTYSARNVTVNGFTLGGAGNPAGVVGWIATNAGN